jgi:NhaA family Na+:H+ antiporter
MTTPQRTTSPPLSILRQFLDSEAAGGIVLMVAAALALIFANSPLLEPYEAALQLENGPLSVEHWINDALMAVFFCWWGSRSNGR